MATYAAPLTRDGPGLLLRDLAAGDDPQIAATLAAIHAAAPDILVLTQFDHNPPPPHFVGDSAGCAGAGE